MRNWSRRVAGVFVLVSGALWVAAEEPGSRAGRAFQIADYFDTAFVGSPELSGDGSLVAFSVRRHDLATVESWSEVWIMAPDGSGLRQMTFGRQMDTSPTFSPDGKRLLFVSDRDDGALQLFVMSVDGGEARQLTSFPMSLSHPVWSPDGRWIAATAAVYPECGADVECNATIATAREDGKLKAYMADELLYRHWDSWRDRTFTHILLLDARSGEVIRDLTPGRWDSPTFSLGGGPGLAFSPDGRRMCYVSNHDPHPESSTNADLWMVDLADDTPGSGAVNLTDENEGWDGDPRFSPDGRFIAFRSQRQPGYEADLFRLAMVDVARGTVSYLTSRGTFDDWVEEVRWTADGKAILFSAARMGRTPIYRFDLTRRQVTEVLTDATIAGWRPTPDGRHIVYSRSSVGSPPELYRAATSRGAPERLTRFNVELEREVDIRRAEELWVPGDDGEKLQVFLVKPHDFDPSKRYPLILNVHGGPQMQWQDSYRGDWQVYPGAGYVVAFPNPTGSTGFGQDVVDGISCDWGGRVYRDLMKVTDALAELQFVDERRMGAMGWSYGGYMMMWFEGHTDRFAALASMMGVYDLRSMYGATEELWFVEHDLCGRPWDSEHYRMWSPSEHVSKFKTPCLAITGERDYRVPYTQSLHFFTDLQKMEVPSRLVVFPEAGHWPSWYEMAFYYLAHLDWFSQWLGGQPPRWDVELFLRNQVFTREPE